MTSTPAPQRPDRVLVVDDDARIRDLLRRYLSQEGFEVLLAEDAKALNRLLTRETVDLIVLDLMLGDRDGIELCRYLRRQRIATPILMLTALTSTSDKVRGLDAGADDYLVKPFELEELLARLRSLLRRAQATEGAVLRCGEIELNLHERRVMLGGAPVKLSAKELALLEYLMRNPRKLLTRTMISESVWDMNYEPGSNVIDVYVSSLRRKIDRGSRRHIETVIGSGYRFVEPTANGRNDGGAQKAPVS